jgi:oligopeptide transport system ATP-binding protein
VKPLLRVARLAKHFPLRARLFSRPRGAVRAVDGIDFEVAEGETLALVGESGCGKSTTARLILRLIEPTAGAIEFEGRNLLALESAELRAQRRTLQIIFQDPYTSLNPRMTVGQMLTEPLALHGIAPGRHRERVAELLDLVGLAPGHAQRYPHEFSGGQRQRIGIARALAAAPKLIVCDEPVSALDVSIQAQVVNLLTELQQRLGLSYVFIAHDLAVVKHIAARVAVMYLGRIVEHAGTRELFQNPRHPYTQALLSAIPVPDPAARRQRIILQGDVPSGVEPPSGCRFRTRCLHARPRLPRSCRKQRGMPMRALNDYRAPLPPPGDRGDGGSSSAPGLALTSPPNRRNESNQGPKEPKKCANPRGGYSRWRPRRCCSR